MDVCSDRTSWADSVRLQDSSKHRIYDNSIRGAAARGGTVSYPPQRDSHNVTGSNVHNCHDRYLVGDSDAVLVPDVFHRLRGVSDWRRLGFRRRGRDTWVSNWDHCRGDRYSAILRGISFLGSCSESRGARSSSIGRKLHLPSCDRRRNRELQNTTVKRIGPA